MSDSKAPPAGGGDAKKAAAPEWPEHFPKDCPGDHGKPVSGQVYRLIRPQCPDKDWKSWKERGIHPELDDCLRSALSCLITLQDAREFRQGMPRFKGAAIVSAELKSEHGQIEQTGDDTHYTLWLRAAPHAARTELFVVVPE